MVVSKSSGPTPSVKLQLCVWFNTVFHVLYSTSEYWAFLHPELGGLRRKMRFGAKGWCVFGLTYVWGVAGAQDLGVRDKADFLHKCCQCLRVSWLFGMERHKQVILQHSRQRDQHMQSPTSKRAHHRHSGNEWQKYPKTINVYSNKKEQKQGPQIWSD